MWKTSPNDLSQRLYERVFWGVEINNRRAVPSCGTIEGIVLLPFVQAATEMSQIPSHDGYVS